MPLSPPSYSTVVFFVHFSTSTVTEEREFLCLESRDSGERSHRARLHLSSRICLAKRSAFALVQLLQPGGHQGLDLGYHPTGRGLGTLFRTNFFTALR